MNNDNIIDKYNIDTYRYYNESLKGFVKINENDELKEYEMPEGKLILEIHYNRYINQSKQDLEDLDQKLTNEIHRMKNQINFNYKNEEYDLIYLYASPIVMDGSSDYITPINYRSEIKNIIKLFSFCLFIQRRRK